MVALQKKVATVHADAVIRHIQKLTCPQWQKMKLHNELKTACHENEQQPLERTIAKSLQL